MKKLTKIFIILLAFFLVTSNYSFSLESPNYKVGVNSVEKKFIFKKDHYIKLLNVYQDSPAFEYGLLPGDKVVKINDNPVYTYGQFVFTLENNKENMLTVQRGFLKPCLLEINVKGVNINADEKLALWSEFCPYPFLFLDINKRYGNYYLDYWVSRKQQFYNELELCSKDCKNKSSCIIQIKQLEEQKNAQYRQEEMYRNQMLQNCINNVQAQNQLQQINNNLNNTNYNLNNINNNLNRMNNRWLYY